MRDVVFGLEFTVLYNIISMSLFLSPSSCLYVICVPGKEKSSLNILCWFSPFMSFSYLILKILSSFATCLNPAPAPNVLLVSTIPIPFPILLEKNKMCSLWTRNIQLPLFFLSYTTDWLLPCHLFLIKKYSIPFYLSVSFLESYCIQGKPWR